MNHLFLASTVFNIITAAMVANDLPKNDEAILWLIDQPLENSNFTNLVLLWKNSPFKQVKIVSYKSKTFGQKIKRKKALYLLEPQLNEIKPKHIYTGNDRRIEFQYLMHKSRSIPAIGHYIDDGTYSYIGKKNSWFGEPITNCLLKKIAYGNWWHQPDTIGASKWIEFCHLAFPELAVEALKQKKNIPLPKNITGKKFVDLSKTLTDENIIFNKIDRIAILPHDSVANDLITEAILLEVIKGNYSAIKNHPRNLEKKHLTIDLLELDSSIPMEVYITLLSPPCLIIGDISTALLTTKWLRPDLEVIAFYNTESKLQALMNKIGINTIKII